MSNPSFMESLNFLDLYCIIKETDSRKESKESFYKKQAESNRGYTLVELMAALVIFAILISADQTEGNVGIGIPLTVERQGTQNYSTSGTEEGRKVTISNFTVDPTQLSEANIKDFYAKIERTINGYYNGMN